MRCLLENDKVDFSLQNKHGLNVAHHACVNNATRVLSLLLNEAYDSIFQSTNIWKETPAHLAGNFNNAVKKDFIFPKRM